MYSVRPVWSVSQITALPLAVLIVTAEPDAAELVDAAAVVVGAAAVVVGGGAAVVVEPPLAAGVEPHATAASATPAIQTPNPAARAEILRGMGVPSCRGGSVADLPNPGTRSVRCRSPNGSFL